MPKKILSTEILDNGGVVVTSDFFGSGSPETDVMRATRDLGEILSMRKSIQASLETISPDILPYYRKVAEQIFVKAIMADRSLSVEAAVEQFRQSLAAAADLRRYEGK